jgi:hypothetical protein
VAIACYEILKAWAIGREVIPCLGHSHDQIVPCAHFFSLSASPASSAASSFTRM